MIIICLLPLYPLSQITSFIVLDPKFEIVFSNANFRVLLSCSFSLCAETPTIIPEFLVVTTEAFVPYS